MKGLNVLTFVPLFLLFSVLIILLVQQPVQVDSLSTTGRFVSEGSSEASSGSSGAVSSGQVTPGKGGVVESSSDSSDSGSGSSSGSTSGSGSSSGTSTSAGGVSSAGSKQSAGAATAAKADSSTESANSQSASNSKNSKTPADKPAVTSGFESPRSGGSSAESGTFSTDVGIVPGAEIIDGAISKYKLSGTKISYSPDAASTEVHGTRDATFLGISFLKFKVPVSIKFVDGEPEATTPFYASFFRWAN